MNFLGHWDCRSLSSYMISSIQPPVSPVVQGTDRVGKIVLGIQPAISIQHNCEIREEVTTYHSSKLLQIELFLQMSTINELIRVEQVNPKNIILMLFQVIETLKSRVEFAFLRVFGHGSNLREQGTWRKLEMTCHSHLPAGPTLPVHFTLGDTVCSPHASSSPTLNHRSPA